MIDLENRIRTGLQSDLDLGAVDALLDDVRRGVRRRRTRRATIGAALAVVALAGLVAGGAALRHHQPLTPSDHRTRSPQSVGTSSVAVTGSGQVVRVTTDDGCPGSCSTIWSRTGTRWTRLASFPAAPGSRQPAIEHVLMAPDGTDGWAWGRALYATHDAGATWTRVTTVPHTQDAGLDVQVGATEAWATSSMGSGLPSSGRPDTLWHTPVGVDDWTRVQPPMVLAGPGKHVRATQWDILDVTPDGRVALQSGWSRRAEDIYVGDGRGWTTQHVSCRRTQVVLPGGIHPQGICGPVGRTLNWGYFRDYSTFQVGLEPTTASPDVGQPDMLYAGRSGSAIDTPSGVVGSDLRLGSDDWVTDWSQTGDHVVILTQHHRVFLSDDRGRTWRRLR